MGCSLLTLDLCDCYLFVLLYSRLHLFILMLTCNGFFFKFSAIIILLETCLHVFPGVHIHECICKCGIA